jgi:hypothetical protein
MNKMVLAMEVMNVDDQVPRKPLPCFLSEEHTLTNCRPIRIRATGASFIASSLWLSWRSIDVDH